MPEVQARKGPAVVVRNESLVPLHRRIALATVCVPFLGTVAALALLPLTGLGALEIGLLVGGVILTNLGIEFGFHRSVAHNSFETRPAIRNAFAVLGSMAAEGRVIHWVADHRRHHACSDTPDDPHSPRVRNVAGKTQALGALDGLWHAHVGHMLTGEVTNCTLFARDVNRDPALRRINDLYTPIVLLGLLIPGLIGGAITGTWLGALSGLLWGGLVRLFIVHHITWSVASFAHRFGATPFANGDHSANNLWLAVPSFGSAYQNNHHAFPAAPFLGFRWWEVDVAGLLIRLLARVGLVWNLRQPSADEIESRRLALTASPGEAS